MKDCVIGKRGMRRIDYDVELQGLSPNCRVCPQRVARVAGTDPVGLGTDPVGFENKCCFVG